MLSALSVTAEWAGICGGLVLPATGLLVWGARRWINEQIVSKLSNDETPVAKYAHDARDAARESREFARQALETAVDTNRLITQHITNTGIHRVSR